MWGLHEDIGFPCLIGALGFEGYVRYAWICKDIQERTGTDKDVGFSVWGPGGYYTPPRSL